MIAGLSRCAWLISKIRRRRIIVENCEVFILVNDVSLARLTATRLHGPEASIACRWGGSCKADGPRAASERSIGTWERTKAS